VEIWVVGKEGGGGEREGRDEDGGDGEGGDGKETRGSMSLALQYFFSLVFLPPKKNYCQACF